jgi:hypothetical protein
MYGSMPADVPAGTARSSPARMRLKGPFAPTGIWHELNDAEGGRGGGASSAAPRVRLARRDLGLERGR